MKGGDCSSINDGNEKVSLHCKHGYDGGCTRSFDDRTEAMVDDNTSAMGVSV